MRHFSRIRLGPLAVLFCLALVAASQPAPTRAATRPIYEDTLARGWSSITWDSAHSLAATPARTGTAIAISITAPWGGFQLNHGGLSTSGYTRLRFAIHGGDAGDQKIALLLLRADGRSSRVIIPAPVANSWTEVSLPLAVLSAEEATITGIIFQDGGGTAQPPFYLDDLAFAAEEHPEGPLLSSPGLHPFALPADGVTQLRVRAQVGDPQGLHDIAEVTVSLRALGMGTLALHDDGRHDDGAAGDGLFGAFTQLPAGAAAAEVTLSATALDRAGHVATMPLGALVVLAPPGGSVPAQLPQQIGWGTNEWNELGDDWQVQSGVPWSYVYRYITYAWYRAGDWHADNWGDNYVGRFVTSSWKRGYTPLVSVYLMLGAPGPCMEESGRCYAQKLQSADTVRAYLAALEKAARQVNEATRAAGGTPKPVIFQLDPDFTGYMQMLSNSDDRPAGMFPDDPSSIPVALNLPGYPNTLAGFGQRIVDLVHETAPNVLVAHHASTWATNSSPNHTTALDTMAMARRTAAFIKAMGGDQADLLTVEWSDRDAGSGLRDWWDDTNQDLPRVNRAILWANTLSEALDKRIVLWQVPAGNLSLDNTPSRYQDNRAAYAFGHPRDLADAGIFAVMFGAGQDSMTHPSTDGGQIATQGKVAYDPPPAPASVTASVESGGRVTLHWPAVDVQDLWGYEVTMRHETSGQEMRVRLSRAPFAVVMAPAAGRWHVRVASYDAMGILSQSPPETVVEIGDVSARLYLPLVRR